MNNYYVAPPTGTIPEDYVEKPPRYGGRKRIRDAINKIWAEKAVRDVHPHDGLLSVHFDNILLFNPDKTKDLEDALRACDYGDGPGDPRELTVQLVQIAFELLRAFQGELLRNWALGHSESWRRHVARMEVWSDVDRILREFP